MTSLIRPEPGQSTAMPLNVSYRVGRIADVVRGRWLDLTMESRGFIWPVLEMYPWLPESLRDACQEHIRFFDQTPGLRRFGVSTLVIARRDGQPEEAGSSSG